ncbi:MAG: hypothetical protein SNJ74_01805 [Fimbriimonadaceae bacterium]
MATRPNYRPEDRQPLSYDRLQPILASLNTAWGRGHMLAYEVRSRMLLPTLRAVYELAVLHRTSIPDAAFLLGYPEEAVIQLLACCLSSHQITIEYGESFDRALAYLRAEPSARRLQNSVSGLDELLYGGRE